MKYAETAPDILEHTVPVFETIEKGELGESAGAIKRISKEIVEKFPNREYCEGARTPADLLFASYESPVASLIDAAIDKERSKGKDTFTAIADVAEAIIPPYDHTKAFWPTADHNLPLEEGIAGEGGACRHQARIAMQTALHYFREHPEINGDIYEVSILTFNDAKVGDMLLDSGHFFIELRSKNGADSDEGKVALVDVTNPHLTKRGDGTVIQGTLKEAYGELKKNYADRGIEVTEFERTQATTQATNRERFGWEVAE